MKRTSKDYLNDILNTIDSINKFIEGYDFDSFCEDEKTIFAVAHGIERIGEATKKITNNLPYIKEQYPQIEWKEIAGMRDIMIHKYFGIDLNIIWDTTQTYLPILKPVIKDILKNLES